MSFDLRFVCSLKVWLLMKDTLQVHYGSCSQAICTAAHRYSISTVCMEGYSLTGSPGVVMLLSLCRQPIDNLTPEERDARTVFCMQLAARIRPRDLEEFFSAVGKVNADARCVSTAEKQAVSLQLFI